jgi:hypothetical protein
MRSAGLNSILVVGSLAIALLIAEAVFYLYPHLYVYKQRVYCEGPEQRTVYHPVFGSTAVPNGRYFESKSLSDGWYEFSADDEGFRNQVHSGKQAVVVLGDSYTRGTLADDNETYPALLDQWLENVSFFNYGMGGYGTAQALLVYQSVGPRRPHQWVVLGYYLGNDIVDNWDSSGARPQFGFVEGKLVQTKTPEERRAKPARETGERLDVHKVGADYSAKSWVYQLHRFLYKEYRTYNFLNRIFRPMLVPEEYGVFEDFDGEEAAAVTYALLDKLAAEVEQNSAKLLIVMIPSWNELEGRSSIELDVAEIQREGIARLAKDSGNVYALDITGAIREAGVKETHGVVNKHFNPFGYYVTAKEIYDWLAENAEFSSGWDSRPVPQFDPQSLVSRTPVCD